MFVDSKMELKEPVKTSDLTEEEKSLERTKLIDSIVSLAYKARQSGEKAQEKEALLLLADTFKKDIEFIKDKPAGDEYWNSDAWKTRKDRFFELRRKVLELRKVLSFPRIKQEGDDVLKKQFEALSEQVDLIALRAGFHSIRTRSLLNERLSGISTKLAVGKQPLTDEDRKFVEEAEIILEQWKEQGVLPTYMINHLVRTVDTIKNTKEILPVERYKKAIERFFAKAVQYVKTAEQKHENKSPKMFTKNDYMNVRTDYNNLINALGRWRKDYENLSSQFGILSADEKEDLKQYFLDKNKELVLLSTKAREFLSDALTHIEELPSQQSAAD